MARRRTQERNTSRRRARRPVKETERFDCTGRPLRFTLEQRTRKARQDCPAWVAPDDMPDHVVLDVINGVVCGALNPKGKGDDKYCRSIPASVDRKRPAPWRCRKHGGVPSKNIRPRNAHNLKYGLYGDALFEEEKELWLKTTAETVDEEIVMAKLRLRRALVAEKDAKFAVEHYEEETGELADHQGEAVLMKRKTRFANMTRLVDQITNQLARLYALRTQRSSAIIEATAEGVKVYLPDNRRDTQLDGV